MQAEAAVRESETLFRAMATAPRCCEVRDDGAGLPSDFAEGCTRSLGLQIVDSLSRQVGGEGVFTSEGGTRFRLAVRI